MKLAIIGATGMLGKPVAHELIKAGFSVRIIACDLTRARQLFSGCEIMMDGLRNTESLTRVLCETTIEHVAIK